MNEFIELTLVDSGNAVTIQTKYIARFSPALKTTSAYTAITFSDGATIFVEEGYERVKKELYED